MLKRFTNSKVHGRRGDPKERLGAKSVGGASAPRIRFGPAPAAKDEENDSTGRWAYVFLMGFTIVLYSRPSDFIPELRVFRLAEFTAVAAIASYALAHARGKFPFVFPVQSKIMLALTFLFTAGVATAFWRFKAMETLTDAWLKTVIIFFLLTQTVISLRRIRGLLWAILLCMLFVSAYSVSKAQYMVDDQGRYIGATQGFLSGNYLGIAVASMFPFMAVFMARTRSWIAVLALLSTAAMLLWQIVLTASRGNFLLIGFSALASWFLILGRYRRTRIISTVLTVSMIAFLLFAPAVFWSRIGTLWGEEESNWMAVSAAQSENQRKVMFWRAVEYTLHAPLLGVGLGCFPIKSGSTEMRASEWLGTHNTFLQVSAEAGIPALVLFVSLIFISIASMRRIMQVTQSRKELEDLNLLARSSLISLMAFAFAGFIAHMAYEFYFYYLVGISIAIQTVYSRVTAQDPAPAPEAVSSAAVGRGRPFPSPPRSVFRGKVTPAPKITATLRRTDAAHGRHFPK